MSDNAARNLLDEQTSPIRPPRNIIRLSTQERDRFVTIDKHCLYDRDLSLKAKGMLVFLLAKPDDWQIYIDALANELPEGRDAIAAAIKELIKASYITRTRERDEQGQVRSYIYTVYEVRQDGKISILPKRGFPAQGFPEQENPQLRNTDLNEERKEGRKEAKPEKDIGLELEDSVPSFSEPPQEEGKGKFIQLCAEIEERGRARNQRFRISSEQRDELLPHAKKHGMKKILELFAEHLGKSRKTPIGDIKFFLNDLAALPVQKKAETYICLICGSHVTAYTGSHCARCSLPMDIIHAREPMRAAAWLEDPETQLMVRRCGIQKIDVSMVVEDALVARGKWLTEAQLNEIARKQNESIESIMAAAPWRKKSA
jgi:DNA-binding MarR family transcriptional regulator